MVYVFGTLILRVSCLLANNWVNLFCPWRWGEGEGDTFLKAGANSNVYSTVHVFHLIKIRTSSLSSVKFSCLINYCICTLFLSLFVKLVRFSHP